MISMQGGTNKAFAGKERRSICGICPAGCWVVLRYDDEGRIAEVRPDDDPSLGMICTLGKHSPDIIYSKDRIQYPLLRKGAKGTYDFERISWDKAFEIITGKLESIKKESGPEATCIYTGRGSFELSLCDIFQPKGPFLTPTTMLHYLVGKVNLNCVASSSSSI